MPIALRLNQHKCAAPSPPHNSCSPREERMAALGGLAAAAAHELGTPLATIQLTAKEMQSELTDAGDLREDAALLVSQAEALP